MRGGPQGTPTPGIRITEGIDIWRSIPRGTDFSLEILTADEAERLRTELLAGHDKEGAQPSLVASEELLFGEYVFADYSGAAANATQRKAIRVAYAQREVPPALVSGSFTRELLVEWMHQMLLSASKKGARICLGQDHSYGLPLGLAKQLGIDGQPWRSATAAFLDGTYAPDAPRFSDVPSFAKEVNRWLRSRGFSDYFWSATKKGYGLPSSNPRGSERGVFSRITDTRRSNSGRGSPMPFSRVGDNGSVGGQSLWGISMLQKLLAWCERDGLPLRCWPFDGLTVSSEPYRNAHVLVEAYPSALRSVGVAQSDEADALCVVEAIRQADMERRLANLLDISTLAPDQHSTVRFEGWILGQQISQGNQEQA